MKSRLNRILSALALGGALAFPAWASGDFADGEVRKVDRSAGKITLKHGEIRSLDMPPMTMVFAVVDKSLLDKVKAGDKVRFRAASQDGRMTVTDIQPTE
jgi:Cu(I)/Ag(I) efflux system periplasmic protein CusF